MQIVENEIASSNVLMEEFVIKWKIVKENLLKFFSTYKTIKMKMELERENRTDNDAEFLYTREIGKRVNVKMQKEQWRNKKERYRHVTRGSERRKERNDSYKLNTVMRIRVIDTSETDTFYMYTFHYRKSYKDSIHTHWKKKAELFILSLP